MHTLVPAAHVCPHTSRTPAMSGGSRVPGGERVPRDGDREDAHGREDADGTIWFTVAQAAAFLGRNRQTIYSWERRGHLKDPSEDEHGRRIYSQAQIAAAERQARHNAAAGRWVALA